MKKSEYEIILKLHFGINALFLFIKTPSFTYKDESPVKCLIHLKVYIDTEHHQNFREHDDPYCYLNCL